MIEPNEFRTHVTLLLKEGYLEDPRELTFVENGDVWFINSPEKDTDLSADSLTVMPVGDYPAATRAMTILKSAMSRAKQPTVFVMSRGRYTQASAMVGRTVFPYLDDFAQILGQRVQVVSHQKGPKSIQNKSAVLIRDEGGLCKAQNLYDLYAAVMVLEKGCQAQVNSWFLGGGKKISFLDATLMRVIYLKKYSKEANLS